MISRKYMSDVVSIVAGSALREADAFKRKYYCHRVIHRSGQASKSFNLPMSVYTSVEDYPDLSCQFLPTSGCL